MIAHAARAVLAALQGALGEVPQNDRAWTWTIQHNGSPYITRTILPRVAGCRPMLHRIHRPDADDALHNHPWRFCRSLILSGGYAEERLVDGERVRFVYRAGDVNRIDAGDFHRITHVLAHTWTLLLVGDRVQEWGFLVDGAVVPWREYLARGTYGDQSKAVGGLS